MQCVEFTLNGVRLTLAGGAGTRSIDNRLYFFPPTGQGSFTVAGYADPASDLSKRVFWTHADLKIGDELLVRIVESDTADSGEIQSQWGESLAREGSEQTCQFCGRSNSEKIFFMVSQAGAICGECVAQASQAMNALANRA